MQLKSYYTPAVLLSTIQYSLYYIVVVVYSRFALSLVSTKPRSLHARRWFLLFIRFASVIFTPTDSFIERYISYFLSADVS